MAIGQFMGYCVVRAGGSTPNGFTGFIVRWPATKKQNAPAADNKIEQHLGDGLVHDQMMTDVRFNFRGADVVEVLERVGPQIGYQVCYYQRHRR